VVSQLGGALERTLAALEPYLLQQGFIGRTPRGRVVTLKAYRHLGLSQPSKAAEQATLFDPGEEL